jgi:C4-dicarboxylate-specific signal transduction histidine kinase
VFSQLDSAEKKPVMITDLLQSTINVMQSHYQDVTELITQFSAMNELHCYGQHIEVTIKDNGCGMSDETKNKLFEPFYTTTAVGAGTGLGLSISFGIVQKHGGALTAQSELGKGSVTLTLPGFIQFKHQPDNPRSLSHNQIWSTNKDDEGFVWAATHGGGLN